MTTESTTPAIALEAVSKRVRDGERERAAVHGIDLDLQALATEQLAERRGAVVALDPWNGEILALVSAPSFDPNLFAVGMSQSQFSALQQDLDRHA